MTAYAPAEVQGYADTRNAPKVAQTAAQARMRASRNEAHAANAPCNVSRGILLAWAASDRAIAQDLEESL